MASNIENSDYFKMLKRMIKAGANRAGKGDEIELAEFNEILLFCQIQLILVVQEQRKVGKSWTDIGDALDITRQAAFKRFSNKKQK